MTNNIDYNKLRGGYYTPKPIADFLSNWAILSRDTTILEPSCGDGVFIESAVKRLIDLGFNGNHFENQVTGVELDPKEANKIVPRLKSKNINVSDEIVKIDDFFTVAKEELIGQRLFDSVVGNPPFIRYQNFVNEYRTLALEIMKDTGLNPNKLTNIWVPFLVISVNFLSHGGRLAMVIPAELFQVNYAGETRKFLTDNFSRINIITFKKLVFPKIQQEIVLLLGEKNGDSASTISTIELNDVSELSSLNLEDNPNIEAKEMIHTKDKWTYYFLTGDEINFMNYIRENYRYGISGDYIEVDVGVVTGQNKFFVLPNSHVLEKGLKKYVSRIVTRSAHLKGISFTAKDWQENNNNDYPMYLLIPPDQDSDNFSEDLKKYIKFGEEKEYHKRYKCSIRKRWFIVPSIWTPDAFMLRQVHGYPKLIINKSNATCTDTIHRVKIKKGVNKHHIVAAMLNSLTFAFSEVIGRSYGGGVMTFEPTECELFPFPINGMERLDFTKIQKFIKNNNIDAVLDYTDQILLVEEMGLSPDEAMKLRNIWKKLRDRRNNRKHNNKKG